VARWRRGAWLGAGFAVCNDAGMRVRRPVLLVALVAVSLLLAASCSDDGGTLSDPPTTGNSTTTAPTDGATTTTTTDAPGDDAGATTTTAFEPPLPETTPNVSQPPDSLLDGTHVVFLVEVDVANRSIVFDLVQWFYRDDYDQAIADGRLSADEPCIELDYCIVNTNQATRTMRVAPGARVSVVDYDDCCTFRRTDDLADARDRLAEGRDVFLLTAEDGELTAVDEVYLS
jgi:hypothetical protein